MRATTSTAGGESLGKASLFMASGTLVSRVLGLVRTAMLTVVFGAGYAADAWNFSNTLPNFFYIVLSSGVLNAVLIPQITRAMGDKDHGKEFVDRLLTVSIALVVIVTVVATSASPLLVRAISGFHDSTEKLAVFFAYLCLPQIAFYGLYAVLSNVLNARDHFGAVMWTPALANIVQIAGLTYFLDEWGKQRDPGLWTGPMVWVLAGSSTVGIAVQAIGLVPSLRRSGFSWRPRWGIAGLGAVSRMTLWTLTSLIVQQAGGFFITWVMNTVRARPGNAAVASTTVQANAFLVFMLPHSLITVSILTSLFPSLSRSLQKLRIREVKRIVVRGLSAPAVFVIPMSIGLMVLSPLVVRVLFVGLAPREVTDTAAVLAAMAAGTVPFGVMTWQQRYCFARENGRLNLWLQALLTMIQVLFATLGLVVVDPRYTVLTIALGQTVGNALVALLFLAIADRQLSGLELGGVARLWARLAAVSLPAAAVAVAIEWCGRSVSAWELNVVTLAVAGSVFVAVFVLLARLARIREVDMLLGPILSRGRRLLKH